MQTIIFGTTMSCIIETFSIESYNLMHIEKHVRMQKEKKKIMLEATLARIQV
jgi:hypothetical protein